jgi:hypothetical protein
MGAIEFDPIVNRVSKKVGNFVYSSWKGKTVIKPYTKPKGESTESQLKIQKAFKAAAFIWKSLPAKMRESWKASITNLAMTEMNMFLSKNITPIADGKPCLLTRKTGMESLMNIAANSSTAGSVTLTYTAQSEKPLLSAVLQKISEEENSPLIVRLDITTDLSSAVIDGLESGKDYFVYLISTDKPFAEATMMSESSGFKVTVA